MKRCTRWRFRKSFLIRDAYSFDKKSKKYLKKFADKFTRVSKRTQQRIFKIDSILQHSAAISRKFSNFTKVFHKVLVKKHYTANIYSFGMRSKNRSIEGCPETSQARERLVSISEHLQVPKWDRTSCPEEQASSVGMPHTLQMFYGNLSQLGKKSNSVIRSRSVIGSKIGVMPDQWRV